MHYFNEFDPAAAEWLRELIRAGHLPAGEVDERDIRDVAAADLRGFAGVHLFAGIGGWPLALRLAGWPADRPVWTGSCPCQPYSTAGKGAGDADPRNLWPEMFRLVRECRPECVFGEQVEGAVRHGWLDRVCADLEGEGYAVGSVVLGAHSVGAPHIRQRLYWVADRNCERRPRAGFTGEDGTTEGVGTHAEHLVRGGPTRGVDYTAGGRAGFAPAPEPGSDRPHDGLPLAASSTRGLGYSERAGREGTPAPQLCGAGRGDEGREPGQSGGDFWSAHDLLPCRDGKSRRVEPGTFPLAHGLPGRVGLLRGYGNAIVPQVAAEFVRAHLDCEG